MSLETRLQALARHRAVTGLTAESCPHCGAVALRVLVPLKNAPPDAAIVACDVCRETKLSSAGAEFLLGLGVCLDCCQGGSDRVEPDPPSERGGEPACPSCGRPGYPGRWEH